jgi:hypothetical protein
MGLGDISGNFDDRDGRPLLVYPTPKYVVVGVDTRSNLKQNLPLNPLL